jgi:hypothetical protein
VSFTCEQHGWQHLLNPCPYCTQTFVTNRVVVHDNNNWSAESHLGALDGGEYKKTGKERRLTLVEINRLRDLIDRNKLLERVLEAAEKVFHANSKNFMVTIEGSDEFWKAIRAARGGDEKEG